MWVTLSPVKQSANDEKVPLVPERTTQPVSVQFHERQLAVQAVRASCAVLPEL
jgi:hypothetical protein|tara:strand:+ start:15728 stop:15886 length:159 start_codon:yes stop_codon:yes gene_type:complete